MRLYGSSVSFPITVLQGGTGLSALGTANQLVGMNAAATAWEYKTNVVVPGDLYVGSDISAKFNVVGTADEVQAKIRANATQTTPIFRVENSGGTIFPLTIERDGITIDGTDLPSAGTKDAITVYGSAVAYMGFLVQNQGSGDARLRISAPNGNNSLVNISNIATDWSFGANGTGDFVIATAGELGVADVVKIYTFGGVEWLYLHNDGNVHSASSPTLQSGTYTPTFTNVANTAARTAYQAQWHRTGNVITVSGKVSIDETSAATLTQIGISFPTEAASNIGAEEDVGGVAFSDDIFGLGARVFGDAANNRATLSYISSADVANKDWSYIFTYEVI